MIHIWQESLAYNLLAVKTYIVKPLWYQRPEGSALNDTDLAYIRLYMESNYGLTCEKKIEDAVTLAAHENSFHPVREYLKELVWGWKGTYPILPASFLGADIDKFNYEIFKLFLLGSIHRAFRPGCKFGIMLCL